MQGVKTDLPVKVSYTVEGSGSYCTILNERHDVYVHPAVPYHASARIGVQGHGGPVTRGKNGTPVRNGAGVHGGAGAGGQSRGGAVMGSCCLRDVAWGVCYARYVYHLPHVAASLSRQRGSSSGTAKAMADISKRSYLHQFGHLMDTAPNASPHRATTTFQYTPSTLLNPSPAPLGSLLPLTRLPGPASAAAAPATPPSRRTVGRRIKMPTLRRPRRWGGARALTRTRLLAPTACTAPTDTGTDIVIGQAATQAPAPAQAQAHPDRTHGTGKASSRGHYTSPPRVQRSSEAA